ncbi:MAG: SMP-30/gluconolactonase/LRE family protein [Candidatus Rokuibacteriota bacterium]
MGAGERVRWLAERAEAPQGRPLLHRRLQAGPDRARSAHGQGRAATGDGLQRGLQGTSGRVFRLRANGALDKLAANVPSPNGITLNTKDSQVYVAVTRAQQIWRLPLMADGQPSKTGTAC